MKMNMKKLIMAAAIVCVAVGLQAASVGWTCATGDAEKYGGKAYQFFVIGQNGVEKVQTVTDMLKDGTSTAGKAFASGTVDSGNGAASTLASKSGKTLDAGTYTAFMVIFDSATPTAGSSKYALISGQDGLTKTFAATAASVTFVAGNVSSVLSNADNWKSFGEAAPGPGPDPTPEPTSGLLLLVGGAMLALRRKQK